MRLINQDQFAAGEGDPVVDEPFLLGWHGQGIQVAWRSESVSSSKAWKSLSSGNRFFTKVIEGLNRGIK
jgi:hypothetical protein